MYFARVKTHRKYTFIVCCVIILRMAPILARPPFVKLQYGRQVERTATILNDS